MPLFNKLNFFHYFISQIVTNQEMYIEHAIVIMSKLPWNLNRRILDFHNPFMFRDMRQELVYRKLRELSIEDNFNRENDQLVVNTVEIFEEVIEIFDDFEPIIPFMENFAIISIQNYSFCISLNVFRHILHQVDISCQELQISYNYNEEDSSIIISTTENSGDNIEIIRFFYEFVVNFQVNNWEEEGEELIMITAEGIRITIYSFIRDINIQYDIFF